MDVADNGSASVKRKDIFMQLIRSLKMQNFLSFAPDADEFEMQNLNVLIGPNGSGKSNVIEALELLRSTPTDFATAIRDGGGAEEWLWKGEGGQRPASIDIETGENTPSKRPLRYRLEFTSINRRVEVIDEAIEEIKPPPGHDTPFFYYRFQNGKAAINAKIQPIGEDRVKRELQRKDISPDQSVLAQRRDPELYPEVAWVEEQFSRIQTFREWSFGRYAPLRRPQPADLPAGKLLENSQNLGIILNHMDHNDRDQLDKLIREFLPGFEQMTTPVFSGGVQFHFRERGLLSPIPSTRLSDGTIRFLALLAILLNPSPPSFLCIEEPELGLHPDAVSLIADLLVEASSRMQILVTTHSEALVAALSSQPETVVVCEKTGSGTNLRRLDSEKLKDWLEDYSLAGLWRIGALGANP